MSAPTLLRTLAALALPVLALARAAAAAAADPLPPDHVHRLKSLTEECAFTLGKSSYNLCPVLSAVTELEIASERQTDPTLTKTAYRIDLRAPLAKVDGVPGHEQCPQGTWICQTITNRRPRHEDEEPRVLQVVPVAGELHLQNSPEYRPGVNPTAQVTPSRADPKVNVLHVRLHGGYYMGRQQSADFQFLCSRDAEEPSTPKHLYTWNNTHTFQWQTQHACGSQRATPVPPNKDTDVPPDADDSPPPPPPSSDEPAPELVDDARARRPQRTAALLLGGAAALAALGYGLRAPLARLAKRHRLRHLLRTTRFRVGEGVLVRWAYEDLEMDDGLYAGRGGAEGEEDVMVNFRAVPEEGGGEGIPLKPSPRWASSYGTA